VGDCSKGTFFSYRFSYGFLGDSGRRGWGALTLAQSVWGQGKGASKWPFSQWGGTGIMWAEESRGVDKKKSNLQKSLLGKFWPLSRKGAQMIIYTLVSTLVRNFLGSVKCYYRENSLTKGFGGKKIAPAFQGFACCWELCEKKWKVEGWINHLWQKRCFTSLYI